MWIRNDKKYIVIQGKQVSQIAQIIWELNVLCSDVYDLDLSNKVLKNVIYLLHKLIKELTDLFDYDKLKKHQISLLDK